MAETYLAIRACRYEGKRFRVGDELPVGWEPNKHFRARAEALDHIKADSYMALGFDPERERGSRAAQQKRSRDIKGSIDMDDAEKVIKRVNADRSSVDFDDIDENTSYDRKALGNALFDQFGLKLNWAITSKKDLIAAGREAAERANN